MTGATKSAGADCAATQNRETLANGAASGSAVRPGHVEIGTPRKNTFAGSVITTLNSVPALMAF